jgi:hypothetical protein
MKRRKFQRYTDQRQYRKLFVIATEGDVTEREYFARFQNDYIVDIKCLDPQKKSAPLHVLKRIRKYLKETNLNSSDEAWLVVDRDSWKVEQLDELYQWSTTKENFGFALSNPKFEYWLLLHFEQVSGSITANQCSERLQRHLLGYDKRLDTRKITTDMIVAAINRAEQRDKSREGNWPKDTGTTVYQLVKNIIATEGSQFMQ